MELNAIITECRETFPDWDFLMSMNLGAWYPTNLPAPAPARTFFIIVKTIDFADYWHQAGTTACGFRLCAPTTYQDIAVWDIDVVRKMLEVEVGYCYTCRKITDLTTCAGCGGVAWCKGAICAPFTSCPRCQHLVNPENAKNDTPEGQLQHMMKDINLGVYSITDLLANGYVDEAVLMGGSVMKRLMVLSMHEAGALPDDQLDFTWVLWIMNEGATIIRNYQFGDPNWAAWYAGELQSRVWHNLIETLSATQEGLQARIFAPSILDKANQILNAYKLSVRAVGADCDTRCDEEHEMEAVDAMMKLVEVC